VCKHACIQKKCKAEVKKNKINQSKSPNAKPVPGRIQAQALWCPRARLAMQKCPYSHVVMQTDRKKENLASIQDGENKSMIKGGRKTKQKMCA
jgi:hypothetical protein